MNSRLPPDDRRRFGLARAVALSILLHALLILLSVWFPLTRSAAVAVAEPDDASITFRFDRPVEPTTDDPLEDAPFLPVEPRTPEPLPEPSPEPATEPAVELPPEPVLEPAPEEPPLEEPARDEPDEPSGTDLRESPDGLFRRPPAEPSAPERTLDMNEALRDFGRALRSRPSEPEPSASAPQPNVVAPDLSRLPYSGFGMGNLVFESVDFDWSDYGRQVYMAIWRAWHHRLWLTTDEFEKWAFQERKAWLDHALTVRFVIERNGQVTGITLEDGSGCEPLDASALDALAEVILPPLPDAFPRDRETVRGRFIAKGHVRQMRAHLSQLKALGLF